MPPRRVKQLLPFLIGAKFKLFGVKFKLHLPLFSGTTTVTTLKISRVTAAAVEDTPSRRTSTQTTYSREDDKHQILNFRLLPLMLALKKS
jgi:hypothetical protein